MLGSKCLNETQALAGLLDNELMSRLSAPSPTPQAKGAEDPTTPLASTEGWWVGLADGLGPSMV